MITVRWAFQLAAFNIVLALAGLFAARVLKPPGVMRFGALGLAAGRAGRDDMARRGWGLLDKRRLARAAIPPEG